MTRQPDVAIIGNRFMRAKFFDREIKNRCGSDFVCQCMDLHWPNSPLTSGGEAGDDAAGIHEYCRTPREVIEHIGAAEIVVTHHAPMTREVFAACRRLKFPGVSRGVPVNVDLKAATDHGVVVVNTPGATPRRSQSSPSGS